MFSYDVDKLFGHNPKSILNFRKDALNSVESLDLPNMGKLMIEDFSKPELNLQNVFLNKQNQVPVEMEHLVNRDSENVIIVKDGNIIFENLTGNYQDIYINDFNSAFEERPEVIIDFFNKEKDVLKQNKMTALNSAYMNSGILIDIPKNILLKDEIKLYYVQENADFIHRTLVNVGDNSSVKFVEYFTNTNECYVNIISDLFLSENSKVHYFSVDNFNRDTVGYSALRSKVDSYANLQTTKGILSNGNIISDTLVDLSGEFAETEIKTIAVADATQKQNVNTATYHNAKMSKSNIVNQGVAKEKSKVYFNNFGKIEQGMSESKAYQSTRGVILDRLAQIQANPFLLIDEYDVEAAHGATIGKFDDESLFYLMSRGLSKSDAEKLIVNGFINPIIANIDNEALKEQLGIIINKKLG